MANDEQLKVLLSEKISDLKRQLDAAISAKRLLFPYAEGEVLEENVAPLVVMEESEIIENEEIKDDFQKRKRIGRIAQFSAQALAIIRQHFTAAFTADDFDLLLPKGTNYIGTARRLVEYLRVQGQVASIKFNSSLRSTFVVLPEWIEPMENGLRELGPQFYSPRVPKGGALQDIWTEEGYKPLNYIELNEPSS